MRSSSWTTDANGLRYVYSWWYIHTLQNKIFTSALKTCWGWLLFMSAAAAGADGPMQQQCGWRRCRSLWAGLQCYKLPSLFSPVETSDHTVSFYISDEFFSFVALCCNGTATHENTHGRLFEDISQSLSPLPFLGHFPITETLENQSGFSVLCAKGVPIILENML